MSKCGALRYHVWVNIQYKNVQFSDQFSLQFNTITTVSQISRFKPALTFSATYFQYQQGMLSDSDWFETRAVIHYWVAGAGFRAWWAKSGRKMFGPDFVTFIDAEIREFDSA